jgi:hypothetical protein
MPPQRAAATELLATSPGAGASALPPAAEADILPPLPPLPPLPLAPPAAPVSPEGRQARRGTAPAGPTPAEIAAAMAATGSVRAAVTTPTTRDDAARPSAGTRRLLLALGALLAVLILLAAGAWWWLGHRRPQTIAVAVPSPLPTHAAPAAAAATLVVLGSPWGEVTRIQAEDGHELPLPPRRDTPLVLSVPAGRYVVTLTHPGAPAPATCEAVAAAGPPATCRAQLLPVDALQYFREAGWWR